MARKQLPIYFLYVDLSAAFDHIVRSWLWKIIRLRFPDDTDTTLIDILESLYNDTKCKLEDILFDTSSIMGNIKMRIKMVVIWIR